jgi:hypothetical protein
MADDERATGTERTVPPRDIDPDGSAVGVDDHIITPHPNGIGHQPTGRVDDAAEREHLTPSWQGAKVEDAPDPEREPPPDG